MDNHQDTRTGPATLVIDPDCLRGTCIPCHCGWSTTIKIPVQAQQRSSSIPIAYAHVDCAARTTSDV